jgi:hypothetical protein
MNILFYGNCQIGALRGMLNMSIYDYICCHNTDITKHEFISKLGKYDIIITQPLANNYRSKPYLSTKFIIEHCQNDCKILIIDVIYFDFYYLDLTYIHFNNSILTTPGDYHYKFMQECYKNGNNISYYINNIVNNIHFKHVDELDHIANDSLNELQRRYEVNKQKYIGPNIHFIYTGDYIRANYKHKLLFYSMNHPSKHVLQFVCESILDLLDIPHKNINYDSDPLSSTKCIIYKCIQPCVFFDITECQPFMYNKHDIRDICKLYYNVYNKIYM